jgi:hypothetical protein
MIEPMRVCELEAGSPYHQVLRFHRMADTSKREDHGEAGARSYLEDQLDRQQRDHRESHRT